MTNGSLIKVEIIAECSHWNILQYFQPALSDNWSLKPFFFFFFESGRFTQVLLCSVYCQAAILENQQHWTYNLIKKLFKMI